MASAQLRKSASVSLLLHAALFALIGMTMKPAGSGGGSIEWVDAIALPAYESGMAAPSGMEAPHKAKAPEIERPAAKRMLPQPSGMTRPAGKNDAIRSIRQAQKPIAASRPKPDVPMKGHKAEPVDRLPKHASKPEEHKVTIQSKVATRIAKHVNERPESRPDKAKPAEHIDSSDRYHTDKAEIKHKIVANEKAEPAPEKPAGNKHAEAKTLEKSARSATCGDKTSICKQYVDNVRAQLEGYIAHDQAVTVPKGVDITLKWTGSGFQIDGVSGEDKNVEYETAVRNGLEKLLKSGRINALPKELQDSGYIGIKFKVRP